MILIQRADCSLQRAQQLNPMVQVTADSEDISNKSDSFFKDFDLVVATNCSADQLVGTKKLLLYYTVQIETTLNKELSILNTDCHKMFRVQNFIGSTLHLLNLVISLKIANE